MKPLELQSEKFSPTGSIPSKGVLNQLGRPKMDILTVMVREAVQNSWDARMSGSANIHFGLSWRTLRKGQLDFLRRVVFAETPDSLNLRQALHEDECLQVLEVYDRGTTGLGGPTRADVVTEGTDEARDFVDFLRNVGQPPDKQLSGGTFGYGKAALYLVSKFHTMCVHTHATYEQRPVQRFIASALGDQFTDTTDVRKTSYTGRHWWGREADKLVEPVTGNQADEIASELGMPEFTGGGRGTTIMLLSPFTGDWTVSQALNVVQQALLWYFWPKMLAYNGASPAITFEMSHEGRRLPIPSPSEFPPLDAFTEAMALLKKGGKDLEEDPLVTVEPIEVLRPKQHLGQLALVKAVRSPRQMPDLGGEEEEVLPFQGPAHHVALMRQAELVVKYQAGPPLESDRFEYAGVFIADKEVDPVFARAEPPTHDDWIHDFLDKRHEKTYIRVGHRRIQEKVDDFIRPSGPGIDTGGDAVPLGAFASEMGTLLAGQEGEGGKTEKKSRQETSGNGDSGTGDNENGKGKKGSKKKRGGRAMVQVLDDGSLEVQNGQPVLRTTFSVFHVDETTGTRVSAVAGAILDNNQRESDPPAGDERPRVAGWVAPDGTNHEGSPEIVIAPDSEGPWQVVVTVPANTMVGLDLTAAAIKED